MSKLNNLSKLFNNNRFLMVFSFILAIVIWFVVSIVYSPETARTISQIPVEITFSDPEAGYQIYSETELFAKVEVSGKKYEVEQLGSDSFIISATVGAVNTGGMYTLDLDARKRDSSGDYKLISVTPSTVNVMIDVERETQFDVEINCVGATIAALEEENENLVLEPAFSDEKNQVITVKGPDSEVRQIARVEVMTEVNRELSKTELLEARVVAYDSSGAVVYDTDTLKSKLNYVTFSYEAAQVIANVNLRKTVPLTYQFSNEPSKVPDIELREVRGSGDTAVSNAVNTVSIKGARDIVSQMDKIVLDGVLDFSKIDLSNSESSRFELKLPTIDGVTYDGYNSLAELSESKFIATVKTDNLITQAFSVDSGTVKVVGVPAGCVAKVNEEKQLVYVTGPRAAVSDLSASDFVITVNAADTSAGTTTDLKPVITLKENDTCWVTGSYSISVDVTKK